MIRQEIVRYGRDITVKNTSGQIVCYLTYMRLLLSRCFFCLRHELVSNVSFPLLSVIVLNDSCFVPFLICHCHPHDKVNLTIVFFSKTTLLGTHLRTSFPLSVHPYTPFSRSRYCLWPRFQNNVYTNRHEFLVLRSHWPHLCLTFLLIHSNLISHVASGWVHPGKSRMVYHKTN